MFVVTEKIREHASNNALAPAVIVQGGYLSYFELQDKIARISNTLIDRKVPRGAKMFINIRNADLRLLANIACMHAGLVPILAVRLDDLGGDVSPDYVIGSPEPNDPDLTPDLMIDSTVIEGRLTDATLRDVLDRDPEDILYIATTSGTTGRKKVIAEKYRAFVGSRAISGISELGSDRRLMITFGNVSKWGTAVAMRLFCNGAAFVRQTQDPVRTLNLINACLVTDIIITPRAAEMLVSAMEANNIRCPSLRVVALTGSLFPVGLLARLEQRIDGEITINYGTAEVGGISRGVVTSETYEKGYVGDLRPDLVLTSECDRANPRVLTFTNEKKVFVHRFVGGELVRNDESSFRVPDIGFVEDGRVYLIGREDEVYNFSGMIIAYSVIEDAVRALVPVEDIAVVSANPESGGTDLVIGIVTSSPETLGGLTGNLADRLRIGEAAGDFHILPVAAIARNEAGKVDRNALLAAYRARTGVQPAGEG